MLLWIWPLFFSHAQHAHMNQIMNNSVENNCTRAQTFTTFSDFAICYEYASTQQMSKTVGLLLLAFLIAIFNIAVIVLIVNKSSSSFSTSSSSLHANSVFNQILIGYCLVNGITGLIDMPLIHFFYVFNYWPFGKPLAIVSVILDDGLAETTILHMAYLSYARLRSIQAPGSFKTELLIRKPTHTMAILWFIGFSFWTVVLLYFGVSDFTTTINYNSNYIQLIVSGIGWFSPLVVVLVLMVFLTIRLRQLVMRRDRMHVNGNLKSTGPSTPQTPSSRTSSATLSRRVMRMSMHTKFQIFSFTFMAQWLVANLIVIIQPFCDGCVSPELIHFAFVLTYLVCLTDAILILLLNTNVSFKRAANNKQDACNNF